MNNEITLYQEARTGKTKVWSCKVVDCGESGFPELHYSWGLVGGKLQQTLDVISKGVNQGKSNETTPIEQAKLELERKSKKKKEEGYVENLDSIKSLQSISFYEKLPKSLCFYKPKNSIDEKKVLTLEKKRASVYTVKRDGMMHIVRRSEKFGVEIYSRRMDDVTQNYPHLIDAFEKLPVGTVLLGEIVLEKSDGKDDFNATSKICRSDPSVAIEKQELLGKVKYFAFDLAFYNKQCALTSLAYIKRFELLGDIEKTIGSDYFKRIERVVSSHKDALSEMAKRGLEGLVVWDGSGVMKQNEAFTFNGKAYRPNVLWKSKPKYEDDFIVRFDPANGVGEFGKGKNYGKLKSVFCYQLDEEGNEVFLAKCGGGLTDEQREYYTSAEFPRVWRVEYDSIQPGTGALRFPVFNADRTSSGDKQLNECLMSEDIKKAKEQEKD